MAARCVGRPLWRLGSISSAMSNPGKGDQAHQLHQLQAALIGSAAATSGRRKGPDSGTAEWLRGADRSTYDVPRGHHGSDLSDTACHIGLMRMRDLTLREDISLLAGSSALSIAEALKGRKVLLVGLPGGKICAEKHMPEYLQRARELVPTVFDKILCIIPESCADLKPVVDGVAQPEVSVMEDKSGAFVRMMGLERAKGAAKSQRYAAIVEDGILTGLRVEKAPSQVKATTVDGMLALWSKITKHR